jgi:succinate dehydrogenase / fumarate reductase, membrane anchor subunit
MLAFIVYFLSHFVGDPPHSYPVWRSWLMSSGVSIATVVFFLALLAHAWVGVRDVIMDYVHPVAIRLGLLALLGFGLIAMGIWVARILWMEHAAI